MKVYTVKLITSSNDIKNFDFKHPSSYALDSSAIKVDSDFRALLNSVDTSKIVDHKISKKIGANYKYFKHNQKAHDVTLFFSPIVFSTDLKKGVCVCTFYSGPEQAAAVMCYLRKIKNKWVVVQMTRLWIS